MKRNRSTKLIWGWHRTKAESPDGTATWHLYTAWVNRYGHRFLSHDGKGDHTAVCGRVASRFPHISSWYRPAKAIVCYDCRIIAQSAARIPEETGERKRRG